MRVVGRQSGRIAQGSSFRQDPRLDALGRHVQVAQRPVDLGAHRAWIELALGVIDVDALIVHVQALDMFPIVLDVRGVATVLGYPSGLPVSLTAPRAHTEP